MLRRIASAPSLAVGLIALALTARCAAQDAAAGAQVFISSCGACHSIARPPSNGVGPSLAGVVGRQAGSLRGYAFSPAMARFGEVWKPNALDAFIEAPSGVVPGTRMPFGGLSDPVKRANLIAYLKMQK